MSIKKKVFNYILNESWNDPAHPDLHGYSEDHPYRSLYNLARHVKTHVENSTNPDIKDIGPDVVSNHLPMDETFHSDHEKNKAESLKGLAFLHTFMRQWNPKPNDGTERYNDSTYGSMNDQMIWDHEDSGAHPSLEKAMEAGAQLGNRFRRFEGRSWKDD